MAEGTHAQSARQATARFDYEGRVGRLRRAISQRSMGTTGCGGLGYLARCPTVRLRFLAGPRRRSAGVGWGSGKEAKSGKCCLPFPKQSPVKHVLGGITIGAMNAVTGKTFGESPVVVAT